MASRSLGTLTLDIVAKIGGYTAGLDKAEKEAAKRAKAIENAFDTAATGVGIAFGAMAAAAAGAFAVISNGIEKAASFQDIADMTGGSAEGFANFAVSAKVAGVEMNDLASASVKLTKSLTGVDDESKAAGAALKAIGLNIEEFKNLRPDQQIEAVAQALGNFEEGAGKTAVALDLFGKSGANVLKFLKDYQENGGAVNILTQEQIKAADEYGDTLTRNQAKLGLYVSAVSTSAIPALNALTLVITDVIKEMTGLGGATDKLANDKAIQAFADTCAEAFAKVLSGADFVIRAFGLVGDAIGATAATGVALANGEFRQALNIQVDGFKNLTNNVANFTTNTLGDKFRQALNQQKEYARQSKAEMRGFDPNAKPTLNYSGASKKTGAGKKDNSAAQEAKAQLASDLQDIKAAQDAIINTNQNAQKILEAERSAGLKDEREYYAEKLRLLNAANAAEQAGLSQQIDRLQRENLTGKEAIENQRKIAEAQAKLTKSREDAATAVQVLAIQEESAYRKIAGALLAARQAAQDYFDTTNRGYERSLAALGQGSKQRDMLAAIQQIEDRYQQQRQDLANRRSQAELQAGGALTAAQAKQYDDQFAIINEFQEKAVGSYQSYYAKLNEAQKDWTIGASEALKNYADEAANTAKQTEEIFSSAFKGLEDALTDFVTTGKADFKSLADSIIKDVIRMTIKQQITGPLSGMLGNAIGGSSAGTSTAGGGENWVAGLAKLFGFASGGFTGYGNPSDPAGIVHKGEWVIPAEQVREIGMNNLRSGNLGGMTQNLNVNIVGIPTNNTVTQIAQEARRRQQTAAARF